MVYFDVVSSDYFEQVFVFFFDSAIGYNIEELFFVEQWLELLPFFKGWFYLAIFKFLCFKQYLYCEEFVYGLEPFASLLCV